MTDHVKILEAYKEVTGLVDDLGGKTDYRGNGNFFVALPHGAFETNDVFIMLAYLKGHYEGSKKLHAYTSLDLENKLNARNTG